MQKCKYFSRSRDACFGQVTILSKVKVRIPARCDDCFNRAVANIERNCNGCIAAVMRQVNTYDSDMKVEPNPERLKLLGEGKSYVKTEIREFERRRDIDIAELRRLPGL